MFLKRTFTILLLGTTLYLSAQSFSISGRLLDRLESPLDYVTVILLNKADSSFHTGTLSTEGGHFKFTEIKRGDYIVEVSHLGYKKQSLPVRVISGNIFLSDILLEENIQSLSEVTITAKREFAELESGKISYNLDASISGSQGTALDALKNLPGVLVREDGSFYLYGQAGVNVMIDGKLTYLSGENLTNLLQSISASSVNKIELITHPSSRNDASGNSGLINIQTKKIRIQGTSLGVTSNYQQGKYAKGNESVNFSFRRNKLNVYADYSFNWGREFLDVVSPRTYLDPTTFEPLDLTMHMTADRRFNYRSHYLRGGIDYDFSDKMTVDVYATQNWYEQTKKEKTISAFSSINEYNDSTMTTFNDVRRKHSNTTGGINLSYDMVENGKWDISFDFQRFDHKETHAQQSEMAFFDQSYLLRDTLSRVPEGDIHIYTGQTNISLPLSDKIRFGAGVKTAFVSIGNHAIYRNLHEGIWQDNASLSSDFSYDENINAGYLQLSGKLSPRLSFEAGLRIENTHIEGRQVKYSNQQDSTFKDNYIHLFPTVSVQHQLSENSTLSLLYGRRIIRPNYRDLNPFIEVNDKYLHEQGNTELRPELTDNFEIS